jgi:streptogramin lyase
VPHGAAAKSTLLPQTVEPGASFLFRFDATSQTFLTIPLPSGSNPVGVAVTGTNPTHVWVAEYGLNQIGHLVFTDTSDYELIEYAITSTTNSGPYRVTIDRNYVWFTERGVNRVGRLNAATGYLDEFYGQGLSPNAGLADIQIAPDGAIWLAGQQANQLIRLTVDSPSSYSFQPFTNSLLIGPFDLAIEDADSIWFTAPAAHRIGRLIPSLSFIVWPLLFPPNDFKEPYEIVFRNGSSWTADRAYNRISRISMDTLTLPDFYEPLNRPAGIAVRNSNVFWITQQSDPGAVARLVFTSVSSYTLESFALPTSGLLPTGVDIAAANEIWLAAYKPYQVYLPIILKNVS